MLPFLNYFDLPYVDCDNNCHIIENCFMKRFQLSYDAVVYVTVLNVKQRVVWCCMV